jgi:DNA gyrase subunit A
VTLIGLDEGAKLSGLQRIVENDANVADSEIGDGEVGGADATPDDSTPAAE